MIKLLFALFLLYQSPRYGRTMVACWGIYFCPGILAKSVMTLALILAFKYDRSNLAVHEKVMGKSIDAFLGIESSNPKENRGSSVARDPVPREKSAESPKTIA